MAFTADGAPVHYHASYPALADLAAAAVRCGRRAEAAAIIERTAADLAGNASPRLHALISRARGLLADPGDAEPHFRAARQAGGIEFAEYDEGMFMFGLLAAAHRLPFLPTRAGLGSGVLRVNPDLRTVRLPYGDGEELVAVPALTMDVALVHLSRADARGNAQYLGPDPYFDDLYAKAAGRCYVSCERLVDTADLLKEGPVQSLLIS
ncbi:CoA transferase subunit A, partial [Amycolatopsis sp. WAC 04182]|uniref:CoA transferase subunit A n=1 Tax=Amycolatopsis sp. WAC 04182 TaxID=2203198 RepID=UPI00272BAEE1